jgi:hypothetical protein
MDPTELFILVLRLLIALGLYAFLFALIRAGRGWWRVDAAQPMAAAAKVATALRLTVVASAVAELQGSAIEARSGDVLGRAATASISLPDPTVSGSHARLVQSQKGWQITDLGSTNGTWVNDHAVRESAQIKAGDSLRLGDLRIDVSASA